MFSRFFSFFFNYFLHGYTCVSYKIVRNAVPKLTCNMKNHSNLLRTFFNLVIDEMFISLDQSTSCWKQCNTLYLNILLLLKQPFQMKTC